MIVPGLAKSRIVDTPIANLSEAQKAWLMDDQESALHLYTEALPNAPEKEVELYNIAYLHFLHADYQLSRQKNEQALQHNGDYGPALLLQGMIAYRCGDFSAACKSIRKSVKYHPMPEIPYFYLGRYQYENGHFKEALENLKKSVHKNRLFTYPYALIAKIYRIRSEYEEALKYLLKGLKFSYDADILLGLIDISEQMGQKNECINYSRLMVYLFPNHPESRDIVQRLADQDIDYGSTDIFAPPPPGEESDRFFPVGEDLVYSVYWGPLRIGELHTVVEDSFTYQGTPAYRVLFSLDSNPALQFVASLHSDYISILDQKTKQVLQHYIHARENDIIHEKVYDFDRKKGMFYCRIIREDGHIEYFEKYLPSHGLDGTSILFYARQMVKKGKSANLLTVIDEGFALSEIDVHPQTEMRLSRGQEERVWAVSGENHYKGIVGFTGGFRGWFRDDLPFLPIEADFEIWVGRIRILPATKEELELERYWR